MNADLRVPDVFGEVVGWRAWEIRGSEREPRLVSVTNTTIWTPGEWLEAVCRGGHTQEQIPFEGCSCGIYAASSREHLLRMGYNGYTDEETRVIGQVGLVGKVIPGTQGFRASKARPVRLWVPFERWAYVDALSRDYRVPVDLSDCYDPNEQLEEVS
jgi:hypothetical protein